jgi:hypothetical protein
MPRFSTVVATRCEKGHTNLFEIRRGADFSAEARALALLEPIGRKCRYCESSSLALIQVFATKEVSLPTGFTIWGYTCRCGERVEVARVESASTVIPIPPASQAVKCLNGHSRVIQKREFPSLEHWHEETA